MRKCQLVLAVVFCVIVAGCTQSSSAGAPEGNQITALGRSNNPIPAGSWVGEVSGAFVQINSENGLDEVSYDFDNSGGGLLLFNRIPADDRSGFFVFEFSGFVEEVDMREPTRDMPLTSEEFTNGLSQAVDISGISEIALAGQNAITWTFEPLDPASEFACTPTERDDLDDGALCSTWATDGTRIVQFDDGSTGEQFNYIPDLGIIVAWTYSDFGDGDPFADLAAAFSLTSAS